MRFTWTPAVWLCLASVASAMELARFPRRIYTPQATPLEPMPNLSQALNRSSGNNIRLWIKRDDLTGLTGGGNKTRKLEFTMADALQQKADTVITCGAVQSNHCRLTLSACVREQLKCILVLEERVPGSYAPDASGNHYLFQLLGAERVEVVGLGQATARMEQIAQELREKEERQVYIVPGGASNKLGALGYCVCAQEIQNQVFTDPELPLMEYLVTASGSGGTHAGIAAGMHALRSSTKIIGISTRHDEPTQTDHIHTLASRTLKFATGDETLELPRDKVVVKDQYVGTGYSLPTQGMNEAVTLFARQEGILLDPVYTGKAAAGLIDLVRSGYFPDNSNVLFLHTGGAPSLYHYKPIDDTIPGGAGAAGGLP